MENVAVNVIFIVIFSEWKSHNDDALPTMPNAKLSRLKFRSKKPKQIT